MWPFAAVLSSMIDVMPRLPVLVRRVDAQLQIQYTPSVPGARTSRLMRPIGEPLSKSLFRLQAASMPKAPKSAKKGTAAPRGGAQLDSPLELLDDRGCAITPSTPCEAAWPAACYLRLGDSLGPVPVLYEPAEVTEVLIPATPLAGISMHPHVSTRNCEPSACRFTWERAEPATAGQQRTWLAVGRERSYTPEAADVGAELRLRAEPPLPPSIAPSGPELVAATCELLGQVVLAAGAIEEPPSDCVLLTRRVEAMAAAAGESAAGGAGSRRFRLLSYNLMADAYSRHWDEAGSVHSYCEPRLTKASRRMPLLLAEVLAYAPDVVTLQEVDVRWFETFWLPGLEAHGYSGVHTLKTGEGSSEGCATFARRDAFELVASESFPLNLDAPAPADPSLGPAPGPGADLRTAALFSAQPRTAEGVRGLPTIGQLALLRGASGERLLLANTHLYFANPAVHVRLLQTAELVAKATRWLAQLEAEEGHAGAAAGAGRPAFVLAGDLNSDSTDAVLHFLLEGSVPAWHPDWLHGALFWSSSVGLRHDARRAAMQARGGGGGSEGGGGGGSEGGGGAQADAQADAAAGAVGDAPSPAATGVPLAAAPDSPLASAQLLALSYHRLRRALLELRGLVSEGGDALAAASAGLADAAAAAALLDREAAAGRTLLDSPPLAAAEIAQQLGLAGPGAALTAKAIGDAAALLSRKEGEMESAAASLRAEAVLRATAGGGAPAAEADAAALAAACAGVPLEHPYALRSAYGVHTQPTHVTRHYQNALDWIVFDETRLGVAAVAPLPSLAELTAKVAIPSDDFPSDHVSLVCDLEWTAPGSSEA